MDAIYNNAHKIAIKSLCSRKSRVAALSLCVTVFGRHHINLHVRSQTQVTVALWGCMFMVLISVNTVLRLLKRSPHIRRQNALGSLLLSMGFAPSHSHANSATVARYY